MSKWLEEELRRLKKGTRSGYLKGTEPVFWLRCDDLIVITMEEDDNPDVYYMTRGKINGKMSKQKHIKINDVQPEYSDTNLEEQGYKKLENPNLIKIYDNVYLE